MNLLGYIASLSATLDDIATMSAKTMGASLDDIAAQSIKTSGKTTTILIDDTAAMSGVATESTTPDRELPVIWSIAKGSLVNKAIIIPLALLLSANAAFMIIPILMLGGWYLTYEAAEAVAEHMEWIHEEEHSEVIAKDFEKQKVKGAIKTDFVLSIEIIVIALNEIAGKSIFDQTMILIIVGIFATALVYGTVAAIVRLDDLGLFLKEKSSTSVKNLGTILINSMPKVIKSLGVIGTVAMAAVGGAIITEHIHFLESIVHVTESFPTGTQTIAKIFMEIVAGLLIGLATVGSLHLFKR